MGSIDGDGDGDGEKVHVVEVAEESSADEIAPLLVAEAVNDPSRMSIFSISYSNRKRPKEQTLSYAEVEVVFLTQIISWIWSGSRHSGVLCMATSSIIYCIMVIMLDIFPAKGIPIYQTVFTRCIILLILSFWWLRRTGHPTLIPTAARNVLLLRSLIGFVSLSSFIYSVQNLPVSYAVLLNFATPVMASLGAKIILKEKSTLSHIGGLVCSFLGIFFIFFPIFRRGNSTGQMGDALPVKEAQGIYPWVAGILSSALGGINYCLIRASATAVDQPAYAVFSFALLACPLSAIYLFTFQDFALPNLYTALLIIMLGLLAFSAEMFLVRGLQLEKITKVANVLYTEVLLTQLWNLAFSGTLPSFYKVIGCLIVLASVCSTFYFGSERESDSDAE